MKVKAILEAFTISPTCYNPLNMPVISVLIPCYNVQDTVDEALSSIAAQSVADFEVVAVDDGSSDSTLSRLQTWALRDQRIKVLQLPHQGIIHALNAGIQACSSAYIARMDADDRSTPDRLRLQVELLDQHPETALVGSLVRGFPYKNLGPEFSAYIDWLNTLLSHEDIQREIFVRSPLAHPSVTYRREWVERVGCYQDHGWAEDYDLWARLYLAGAKFSKLDQVLLEWRDHPQRLTHVDGRYSMQNDLRLKAHYLANGPLYSSKRIYIWGTSSYARLLAEQLAFLGCPPLTFVDPHPLTVELPEKPMPVISVRAFFEELKTRHQVIVLVAEHGADVTTMLMKELKINQMHPGIDWFKIV